MKATYFILLGFLVMAIGCGIDTVEQPGVPDSEEYFPLQLGRYIEYQVDSIVFDDASGGNKKDTIRYQLREEVKTYQVSLSGDTLYYIHRLRRNDANQPWTLTDVWTASYDENNALRTEENLTFRKMTMPLYKGLRWIATEYINPQTTVLIGTENMEPYEYWESRVVSIDESAQIGGFMFPAGQVMQVLQTDSDDDLMKRYVHESYVRGIGLVARTDTIFDSKCINLGDFEPCIGVNWVDHASKGYILSQVMMAHN